MSSTLLPPRSSTPFFRRSTSFASASSFNSSSSSLSSHASTDSDDDTESDQDDESEYWSSSGASSSSFRFGSPQSTARRNLPLPPISSSSSNPKLPTTQAVASSTSSRSALKLSLSYLRARQSLVSESYDSLASSLRTLSSLLPSNSSSWESSIAVFIPILERFSRDLDAALRKEGTGSREYRRKTMGKEDAKALIALRQKWTRLQGSGGGERGKGKAKEKESELEWIEYVREKVAKNPPPACLSDPDYQTQTAALLNSVESILLPSCSIPRISLSNLSLTSTQLSHWTALRNLEEVTEWYLSFSAPSNLEPGNRARTILKGIKSLDLSRNCLTSFPSFLPHLFPSLETLSLSHNQFHHLPPSITLFSHLSRLRTHGNHLVSSEKALLPLKVDKKKESKGGQRRRKGTQANSKRIIASLLHRRPLRSTSTETTIKSASLFRTSIELLLSSPSRNLDTDLSLLPPHLLELLSNSYICASCKGTILSTPEDSDRYVEEPLYERVHLVSPGISLPRSKSTSAPTDPGGPQEYEEDEDGTKRGNELASFEQLLLLTIYNRYDSQPPPPLSSRRSRDGGPERRRRNRGLPTIVIGGGGGIDREDDDEGGTIKSDSGNEWRFCVECARCHLGVSKGGKCRCFVCREERRVRGEETEGEGEKEEGEERVLRWLRRRERVKETRGDVDS
ncbi:uncharacterized protein JCM6883_007506 [Sporobolomyces salmoneus]|uniref:uncharacterized protein n=1 Tax=Sporobolomyces salmoneus TaxID=183962 RepID=UPI0031748EA7